MSKKDYELLAGEFKLHIECVKRDGTNLELIRFLALVNRLANRFEAENPLFKIEVFLAACGFPEKTQ